MSGDVYSSVFARKEKKTFTGHFAHFLFTAEVMGKGEKNSVLAEPALRSKLRAVIPKSS